MFADNGENNEVNMEGVINIEPMAESSQREDDIIIQQPVRSRSRRKAARPKCSAGGDDQVCIFCSCS